MFINLTLGVSYSQANHGNRPGTGEEFPEITLPAPASSVDANYLGVTPPRFSLVRIKSDLIMVLIIHPGCPSSVTQAKIIAQAWPSLPPAVTSGTKFRALAVAIGCTQKEAAQFLADTGLPFPVVHDIDGHVLKSLPGKLPQIILVRHGEGEKGLVMFASAGAALGSEQLAATISAAAEAPVEEVARLKSGRTGSGLEDDPDQKVKVSQNALAAALEEFSPGKYRLEAVSLPGRRWAYLAWPSRPGSPPEYLALGLAGPVLCAGLPVVKLVVVIDRQGKIVHLRAGKLYSDQGTPLTADQVARLKKSFLGRRLGRGLAVQPEHGEGAGSKMSALQIHLGLTILTSDDLPYLAKMGLIHVGLQGEAATDITGSPGSTRPGRETQMTPFGVKNWDWVDPPDPETPGPSQEAR
ncbi:MAG: hypothetical protein HQK60_02185 [Deltaproteobacteria bacterium]|nr:hypothetical protein [Deltaproteobacteria bacterium]